MSVSDILSSSLLKHSQVGGPYSARSASQSGSNNLCHVENSRKIPRAGRPAPHAPSVFVLMAVLCLSRFAAGSTQISISPAKVNFGSVAVGTSSTRAVTITNTGTTSVEISQAIVKGAGFSFEGLVSPVTLHASQQTTFDVSFTPAASGKVTGDISVKCTFRPLPFNLPLSGTGVELPSAKLSTATLAFGNQAVGTTSTARSVTLTNSGTAALSITSIALAGTNPSDFAQSNNCGTSVAAGANCAISVTFTPVANGSFTASVTLTDNASGSPQAVALSGTGTSPVVSLSTTSLSFGNEPIDVASSSQTVTLSNTGNAALSITGLAIGGANGNDFAEVADTCGSSVAVGANCAIGVIFTPSLAGAETASITVTDNAPGSPQAVALSGTGTHDVILSWTASSTSGIAGYNVYRGTTSGGESSTPINSTPITGTTYDDANVQAGQTYYYTITAVSSNGTTQSANSNEASATVP